MSNAIKWALLAAAAIGLIALVNALPFVNFIDSRGFSESLTTIMMTVSNGFYKARCLLNNFLSPLGRNILSGLLFWIMGKWAIMNAIKIGAWVYHFIFK